LIELISSLYRGNAEKEPVSYKAEESRIGLFSLPGISERILKKTAKCYFNPAFQQLACYLCLTDKIAIMKKLVLFLMIVMTFAATRLQAQNMGNMQQAWRSYLKDTVKLADPMVDSVMAVRMQYQPQMREIFIDQSASATDKQSKMASLRTEMDTRYKAIGLTDDQIQAIHGHEDAMRAQMRARMNGGSGGGS
jgi:hypothetical protein